MEQYFLSINHYLKLQEIGVRFKKSAFCWITDSYGNVMKIAPNDKELVYLCNVRIIPAIMLQELLDVMPAKIYRYGLYINFKLKEIEYKDEEDVLISFSYGKNTTMMEAAYEALMWTFKNMEERQ